MCDDQAKLSDFLSHSGEVFQEYEDKVEEAAKMQTFIERYENSPFHKLMSLLMTPEEEMEMIKAELEKTKKELEANKKAFEQAVEAKKKEFEQAVEAKEIVIEIQANELERLRRENESSHGQTNFKSGRQKAGVSPKRRQRRARRGLR
jgi:hypothetical protein